MNLLPGTGTPASNFFPVSQPAIAQLLRGREELYQTLPSCLPSTAQDETWSK